MHFQDYEIHFSAFVPFYTPHPPLKLMLCWLQIARHGNLTAVTCCRTVRFDVSLEGLPSFQRKIYCRLTIKMAAHLYPLPCRPWEGCAPVWQWDALRSVAVVVDVSGPVFCKCRLELHREKSA